MYQTHASTNKQCAQDGNRATGDMSGSVGIVTARPLHSPENEHWDRQRKRGDAFNPTQDRGHC